MAGPMRERRAWPPQDRDSDGETAAAFEAAVAGIKQTVARSDEVLSSAKEDLSDHQSWLKAQAAAVEADRERLARFLQRQREREDAVARREQKRARRRARLQSAVRSVKDRVAAFVFAVRMRIWRSIAAIFGGLNAIDAAAARGLRFVGAGLRDAVLYVARTLSYIALSAGRAVRNAVLSVVSLLGSGLGSLGALLASSLGSLGALLASSLGSLRALLAGGAARAGTTLHTMAPVVGNSLARSLGGLAAGARSARSGAAVWLQANVPSLLTKVETLGRAAGERATPVFSSIAARAHALAATVSERIAKAGTAAATQIRAGAFHAKSLLARSKPAAAEAENALSLPLRVGRFDLSQMLIISGALLLVCGALMLGGGLLLRAGKPAVAAASPSEPIAWLFEHDNLALDVRSVFAYAAKPDGMRIRGFAIGGVNLSDQTLDGVESVIKSDYQAKDVKLAMRVAAPNEEASKAFEPGVPGAIPPEGEFALIFTFPEEGGITPDRVLSTFGGVVLKVRYEVGGKEKSFIHYLSPAFLQKQLAEIAGEPKGS